MNASALLKKLHGKQPRVSTNTAKRNTHGWSAFAVSVSLFAAASESSRKRPSDAAFAA